jgi:hypothetical protein
MLYATIRWRSKSELTDTTFSSCTPCMFVDEADADRFVAAKDRSYPGFTHTWHPVEDAVTLAKKAVAQLEAMESADYPEAAHSDAEGILCQVLEAIGPEYRAVSEAFKAARDRVGFLYA